MKISQSFILVLLMACMVSIPARSYALEKRDISSTTKALVVYHFDEPDIQKKMGVDFGAWELHPSYITDLQVLKPTDEKEAEEFGNILRVAYDVSIADEDLPYANYPVFNGVWFHLADTDLSDYDTLVFYVRGDSDAGFTRRFKVELKNNQGEIAQTYVNDVGNAWRRIEIPLLTIKTTSGKQLKSLSSMKELTVVFEKEQVTNKKGVIFLDNIYFSGPKDGIKKPPTNQSAVVPDLKKPTKNKKK